MFRKIGVLILLGVVLSAAQTPAWRLDRDEVAKMMGNFAVLPSDTPSSTFRKLIDFGLEWAHSYLDTHGGKVDTANLYPYFHWIPPYVTSVVPGAGPQSWSAPCFAETTASASVDSMGNVDFTMNFANGPATAGCDDFYLVGSLSHVSFVEKTETQGAQSLHFNTTGLSAAELWDLKTNGIRVFRFLDDPLTSVGDLIQTLLLFVPELTQGVDPNSAERNIDFLQKYAGRVMTKRTTQSVSIDPSTINSGDFLGVIRLDGLDPMLAWAMGSTTGHTTVALRDPSGTLYIAESTVKDSYWPTNGIQVTPYDTWIQQARKAAYQVVHAPLSPENAALFNETAAWARFLELQGYDYGYYNMLYGWIDTLTGNYPCLPPDYTQCLEWPHVEVLFGIIDRLLPFGDMLFDQAFNIRLGTQGLDWPSIVMTAAQQGLQMDNLPYVVEQDSFVYETQRYNVSAMGPSMVCCVFVCNVWKAAGLFGDLADEINCAEQTNFDIYSMAIFDANYVRPPQCVKADPNNQLCQLEGEYTLNLNGYNTRPLYAHEDESCPSLPPAYQRPSNC